MEQHNWSMSSGAGDAVPAAAPWDIDIAFTRLQARATARSCEDRDNDQSEYEPALIMG